MLGSRFIFIKVLSDDFADVDFREELCYHSRPKKQNSKGEKRTKDECRKAVRGGKSGSRSQAVQRGRLRHRRAFRLIFPGAFIPARRLFKPPLIIAAQAQLQRLCEESRRDAQNRQKLSIVLGAGAGACIALLLI